MDEVEAAIGPKVSKKDKGRRKGRSKEVLSRTMTSLREKQKTQKSTLGYAHDDITQFELQKWGSLSRQVRMLLFSLLFFFFFFFFFDSVLFLLFLFLFFFVGKRR